MSITAADNWWLYQAQLIRIRVLDSAGAPVALDNPLLWRLLDQPRSDATVLIEKTSDDGITVAGDDDEIAVIEVDLADYVAAAMTEGQFYMELWDTADNIKLYPKGEDKGDVYIGPATNPQA